MTLSGYFTPISPAAHRLLKTSRRGLRHTAGMNTPETHRVRIAVGMALAALGVFVAGADDKPGSMVLGTVLMTIGIWQVVKANRQRLPRWVAPIAVAIATVVAGSAAYLMHRFVVTAPLFAEEQQVPSTVDSPPSAA